QGSKAEFTTNWLRWWDKSGNLLLWGSELVEQEKQRAEQEKLRAEQEKQRAAQERQRAEQAELELEQERISRQRLVQKLKELGVNPENL
ncbi:hypothetical protein H0902_03440, partial [Microcystis aeruginosa BLCCF108]|nr:hypothetical protein [Microcystis aeruginosa BLCC-F108]